MAAHQHIHDNQFGAAAEGQELFDQLDDEGVPIDAVSDRSKPLPRAAGKAEPAD